MHPLTDLQTRCLSILQRRASVHGAADLHSIAWEMGKTTKQVADCLARLRRKGLVAHVGFALYGLTDAGYSHPIPMPPGE